ncbi:hypothetical protein CDD81_2215 [Ophiocordyceps australis]|uniref:DUF7053 domain-containing protein n=1 Tax=Ophiocordyceps australis TaxID=1399860 RepID=A0A2C5XZG6_9HYPO|nr:hypothetical protein CDD81_2215 [Ophiocordyceps australis]
MSLTRHLVFSTSRPLPNSSRPAALSFLHNHLAMIDTNPLVVSRRRIPPPAPDNDAATQWYAITDKLFGGLTTVEYTCSMQDTPTGLRTHCRAPLGVQIAALWTLEGDEALSLREDVDLQCNALLAPFVKRTLLQSHATLVELLAQETRPKE